MAKYQEINRLKKLFTQYKKAAIIEIAAHIRQHGKIVGIERKHKFPVFYDAQYGESCNSHYSGISLDDCGNLQVQLTNGTTIQERNLNTKYVEDILFIIDSGFADNTPETNK